jgi:peptide/nickel transport system permease protein
LDVSVRAEVLKLLRRLQSERGMAILLITHDWKIVAEMCRRAYVMYAGHIVESGPTEELMSQPAHPYTAGLLAARPRPGQRLEAIPGSVPEPSAWPAGCHFAPRCVMATTECTELPVPMFEPALARRTRCLHYTKLTEGGQYERPSAGCS